VVLSPFRDPIEQVRHRVNDHGSGVSHHGLRLSHSSEAHLKKRKRQERHESGAQQSLIRAGDVLLNDFIRFEKAIIGLDFLLRFIHPF